MAAFTMAKPGLSGCGKASLRLWDNASAYQGAHSSPLVFGHSWHAVGVLCGRQSCLQAAFQAAVEQTTHGVRAYFSCFVSRRRRAAEPEKFVAYRERRPERPPARSKAS